MEESYADPVTARAIAVLNEALERDPQAITALFNAKVSCSPSLARHRYVQVGVYDGENKVGVLGLINGILGHKIGGIAAEGEVDTRTGRFRRIRRFLAVSSGVR